MIEIKREYLRCCNLCHSEGEDVITVYLRHENAGGGMMIQLCNECKLNLIMALLEVTEND